MNSKQQSTSIEITSIDDELIYDTEHILMNYLKMLSFSKNCFVDTNITISPSILNANLPQELIQKYNQFSTKYFTLLLTYDNAIDVLSPLISNYPNSELGLFLSTILNKHMIDISLSLDNSKDKFEKYKNYLLNIYHSILKSNPKQKLLESICSSIAILIIIGIYEYWTNGLEQLIAAAKDNNGGDLSNILMTTLIISNINDIFEKLKDKLPARKKDSIINTILSYSDIIKEFTNFLISGAFSGPKENFVNSSIFKAFIGIVQSFKYFNINIIKIHGFLDFLINCISYLDVNRDLILQICDIFENAFSDKSNVGLIFETNYSIGFFANFLDNVTKFSDFQEIKKCIELIMNVKNYYSKKNINEIKTNQKDIQILFASCNIFSSLCDNFYYIFFIPEIDTIIQDIFFYFINLPIYSISQILLNSLSKISFFIHRGYKFNNYSTDKELYNNKCQSFKIFLYNIHNSVFQNMKLSSMDEYNNLKFDNLPQINNIKLEKYIYEVLKESIYDDEKINYIIEATEFYEYFYDIMNDIYGIKDFCDKLCQFLMNAINNRDLISIDCILLIFNKIGNTFNNEMPDFIFNLIDFVLNSNNIQNANLLNNIRFCLLFVRLLYIMRVYISKNIKYVSKIITHLIRQQYKDEVMNFLIIVFINKLIATSYQNFKNNNPKVCEEDKNYLMDVFNVLSQNLVDNITKMPNNYLIKMIDCIFISCFYNIYLKFLDTNVLYNISEKLFKDANIIFNMAFNARDNKIELYMKYLYIIFSIVKNIGTEKAQLLFELYNQKDPNPNKVNDNNNNVTYFDNINNNIIKIINNCSENAQNFDNNVINSVILLCNAMIKPLKGKTSNYYTIFSNILLLIRQLNPSNIKELDLAISLYKNILTYCKNTPIFTEISDKCITELNIINSKFNYVKKEDDYALLCKKICDFILIYFPDFSDKFNKICDKDNNINSIFFFSFNELINAYEKNDNEDYNYSFCNLIKSLCDNNYIFNGFIKGNIIRLTTALIAHLKDFKSGINNCIPLYFMILKYFCSGAQKEFLCSLNRIFNDDKDIIISIMTYLQNINYHDYNKLEYEIKKSNIAFIKELGELFYAVDTKKNEFVHKYMAFVDNLKKSNHKGLKFDGNCEVTSTRIEIIRK